MVVTSLVPIALSSVGRKTEKMKITTTTIIITTERNTVNHYDKIYGVFENLTNKQTIFTNIFTNIHNELAPMSDVTTIDINHIYRDSKFSQFELFSWKIVFICNECKLEKISSILIFLNIVLEQFFWNSLPMIFKNMVLFTSLVVEWLIDLFLCLSVYLFIYLLIYWLIDSSRWLPPGDVRLVLRYLDLSAHHSRTSYTSHRRQEVHRQGLVRER